MSKRKKIVLIVISVLLLLIIGSVVTVYALRESGRKALTEHGAVGEIEVVIPDSAEVVEQSDGTLITYQGKKYRKNEDIISILCMGVDKESLDSEDQLIGEGGQADTVFVVTLDTVSGSVKMINICRDSMTDVEVYNVDNEYVRTEEMQLCLAYAYGDGKEGSCENMKKTVSRLLYGMPIDAYAAIDLPAISVLNDAVGGVEVEVLEDMRLAGHRVYVGEKVLLKGEMAENYVRSRKVEEADARFDSNSQRMARQKQYLTNFIAKALQATKEDVTVPLKLYQGISEYMVTDIGASEVTYLASLVLQGGFRPEDIVSVPGEYVMGEKHAEYYVDDEGLYEIILDVFYEEVVE